MLPKKNNLGKLGIQAPAAGAGSDIATAETQLESAVREQHALLESYAPQWYSAALRDRAETALRNRKQNLEEVFRELHALLEEYAPLWYSEDYHERADHALQLLKTNRLARAKRAAK